jgi:hypothetical protein
MKYLPVKIAAAYGGAKGKLMGAVTSLAKAFTAMRTFLLVTMIPAISAMMAPFLIPLALVVGAIAVAVAVFHSIKKGIDAFCESLNQGDSLLMAIVDGVTTALLTLVTLPITLIKNFAAWVLEKLGFENIAAKLREFSFVTFIKDGLFGLITKIKDFVLGLFDIDFALFFAKMGNIGSMMLNFLKAIGAGAWAALKAILPGGEGPVEAFNRAFKESLSSGDAEMQVEQTAAIQTAELEALATEKADAEAAEKAQAQGGAIVDASQRLNDIDVNNITWSNLSVNHSDETQAALTQVANGPGHRSDIRLKEDIKLVGKSPSNVDIYEFKYKGQEGVYQGVMAQEVPWASIVGEDGYLLVDYSKVDVEFKKLH